MNPPFNMVGTTATQSADPNTSSGMPWSGAPWISFKTTAAAWTRSTGSLLAGAASARMVMEAITHRITILFIGPQFSRRYPGPFSSTPAPATLVGRGVLFALLIIKDLVLWNSRENKNRG